MLDYTHNINLLSYFDELLSQNDVGKQEFFLKCCNRCTLIDILADDFGNSRACSHIVFIRAGFENSSIKLSRKCRGALLHSKFTIMQLTQPFKDGQNIPLYNSHYLSEIHIAQSAEKNQGKVFFYGKVSKKC